MVRFSAPICLFDTHFCCIQQIIHQKKCDIHGGDYMFETELLGTPYKAEVQRFFKRLDAQLNMVNKFYRCKEQEYLNWATQLLSQMDVLIEETMCSHFTSGNALTGCEDKHYKVTLGMYCARTYLISDSPKFNRHVY